MSLLSQFYPGSGIKSVQRGTITMANLETSASATISSVDTSKSMVSFLGFTTTESSANLDTYLTRISLTNSTTVTVNRNTAFGPSGTRSITVSYEVIEFK